MMTSIWGKGGLLICSLLLCAAAVHGQANLVTIDTTGAEYPETAVPAKLGTARNPAGHLLGATSQNLTLDGKPWLPVMGELHYTRVPESEWEADILRMKAAGVNIVASYVIWLHHEQNEGQFTWTGNKDLRRFAELCAKHGMYLYPRIGPWAHAEARNGGFPDWVQSRGHTRENDPTYLSAVNTFYQQIGMQLKGLYWKDGGPVIGLQIENEYTASGEGKGEQHIRTLKNMALAAGMDVPLYTVTGWGDAAAPQEEVLPVYGGYSDAPWGDSRSPVPPPEVYAFRFDNRSTSDMGAMGGSGEDASSAHQETPFLTAEIGAGIQDTYFRRPVVSADDIAAMVPVMLGSGVNMLGYYMFAGGRNPEGGAITLQESQRTGYPTDVPVKSYDFQAPLDNNGEEQSSLRRLKLVNYFLNDFGGQLAPMRVHRPATVPASAEDLSVPRVAARTHSDSGFIFFNNHTRGAVMPARPGFQVRLTLPGGIMRVPQEPITLPAESYGIWPVNLDLGGVRLRYSTAQLMNRLEGKTELCVFFFALPGVVPEFVLDAPASMVTSEGFAVRPGREGLQLRARSEEGEVFVQTDGKRLHLLLLRQSDAENLWKVNDGHALLLTQADVYTDGPETTLQQESRNAFEFSLFQASTKAGTRSSGMKGAFTLYRSSVPAVPLPIIMARQTDVADCRPLLKDGPPVSWRKSPITLAPDDPEFTRAAHWILTLHGNVRAPQLAEALVRIRYQGDVGRIRQSGHLLDDDFWNGQSWTFGVRTLGIDAALPIDLAVLPLPKSYPMFLQNRPEVPKTADCGTAAQLQSVQAIPVYRWKFNSYPD